MLISSIPHDEHGIEKARRDTLPSTGVVWECCDSLITLANGGIVVLAVRKVDEYHSLLQDAISELEEWDPDADSDFNDSDDNEALDTIVSTNGDLETSMRSLEMGETFKTTTLAHLRLVRLLYPALIKRRLRRFPPLTATSITSKFPTQHQLQSLDALVEHTRFFTEEADEIAGELYAHDSGALETTSKVLRARARDCVQSVRLTWEGEKDEFTAWSGKWEDRLEELERDRAS